MDSLVYLSYTLANSLLAILEVNIYYDDMKKSRKVALIVVIGVIHLLFLFSPLLLAGQLADL